MTLSAVANTETQSNVFSAAIDAPTDMITPESGARLEYINFQAVSLDQPAGATIEGVLYIDAGGNLTPSTTPIADYWATAEPPTRDSDLIRKNKLEIKFIALPVNATYPARFTYKRKFRRPITFNQGTTLVFGTRANTTSKTWTVNVIAVFRK